MTKRPAAAASVLLLRDSGAGIEVLLVRRNADMAFMGGKWVFPGGRLDCADQQAALAVHANPDRVRRWSGRLRSMENQALALEVALGFCMAGCRETFEEVGVLLARHADGSQPDAALNSKLQQERAAVLERPASLAELLIRENLQLDLDALFYWAHWITPPGDTRRFDTHFFAARMPSAQIASLDPGEACEQIWIGPQAAIRAWESGAMDFAPVTLVLLEDLENVGRQHGNVAALLIGEAEREVPPILPKLQRSPAGVRAVLPWDPAYASTPGEGIDLIRPPPSYLMRLRSLRKLRPRPRDVDN